MLRSGCPNSTSARRSSIEQTNFFLSQSNSTLSRPISSNSASFSTSPSRGLRLRPSTNSSAICSMSAFRPWPICTGCTGGGEASWLSVRSPRIDSSATLALNFGLYCFRVVVIALSLSRPPTPKLTYCVVQILGTIIVVTLSRDHIKGNHLEKRAVKNHRMIRVELHPDVPMALDVLPLEKADH